MSSIHLENVDSAFIDSFKKKISNISTKTLRSKIYKHTIKFETNNSLFFDFWNKNWFKSEKNYNVEIYAIQNDEQPKVCINFELKTLIIINATYYGHIKTLTLEFLKEINENDNILSIHGSCIEIKDNGIVILGKSGSGKSLLKQIFSKMLQTKTVADDWLFVDLKKEKLTGTNPENYSYIRTSILKKFPELEDIIRSAMLENIEKNISFERLASKKNRAMVNPKNINKDGVKKETNISLIFILVRDYKEITLIRKINEFEALEKLKKNSFFYPNLLNNNNFKKLNPMFLRLLEKTDIFLINFIKDIRYYSNTIQRIIEDPSKEHLIKL